jgi:transcription initiation factor TFIID subunit 10
MRNAGPKCTLLCVNRSKRVLALASQKFIADVASDALHFSKLRQQMGQGRKPNKVSFSIDE